MKTDNNKKVAANEKYQLWSSNLLNVTTTQNSIFLYILL